MIQEVCDLGDRSRAGLGRSLNTPSVTLTGSDSDYSSHDIRSSPFSTAFSSHTRNTVIAPGV